MYYICVMLCETHKCAIMTIMHLLAWQIQQETQTSFWAVNTFYKVVLLYSSIMCHDFLTRLLLRKKIENWGGEEKEKSKHIVGHGKFRIRWKSHTAAHILLGTPHLGSSHSM